jgi:hypothetical protein
MLRDIKTHLQGLRLIGKETEFDLASPLDAITELWQTTHKDHQLLKSFPKCRICHVSCAPVALRSRVASETVVVCCRSSDTLPLAC